ncbi:DNA double-strand break repair nuclease NurA [Deinococcus multiflagellatus]|uniref:DNA double-strand break repair nuclease NurA n=1 Tax=Deinococcus multiflagellatus TaxID=1656887 RepID=UPI001CCC5F84|nr:DNA double-strand break repair nuclease NurA [Deinococcus multiflagellatus]MBZ9711658.1 DNA double-strand break repair nuclease NurA [Deinococcus multiflagellatus]
MRPMRIRLDPWPVDIESGQLGLATFGGDLIDIETPRWAAIGARPLPAGLRTVYVVDGKRRMESRVFVEDGQGGAGVGGFGAYVVGAVSLCPHGTRQAELLSVRAGRLLAHAPDLRLDPCTLSPRHPHTGQLEYRPIPTDGPEPLAPLHKLQSVMLQEEQELSHGLASAVPFDEQDDREALSALTLQDGTLRRATNFGGAVVGYVKTMQTQYLPPDRVGLLGELRPGERTPIMHLTSETGKTTRFTWYVRLCEAEFYQHPMSGVMRLEMYAPEEPDFLPPIVKEVANLSGTLLCRLGSKAHKDARAPQNLIPTAALEQAMNRAMGSPDLVARRIRAHIATQLGREVLA